MEAVSTEVTPYKVFKPATALESKGAFKLIQERKPDFNSPYKSAFTRLRRAFGNESDHNYQEKNNDELNKWFQLLSNSGIPFGIWDRENRIIADLRQFDKKSLQMPPSVLSLLLSHPHIGIGIEAVKRQPLAVDAFEQFIIRLNHRNETMKAKGIEIKPTETEEYLRKAQKSFFLQK